MNTRKGSFVFIDKVVNRQSERKDLFSVALVIEGHSVKPFSDNCTEQDTGMMCGPGRLGQLVFSCSNGFDCTKEAKPFSCNTGNVAYVDCPGTGNVQCDTPGSAQFECKSGTNVADYFECHTFGCDKSNSSSAFDCNAVVDYMCSGKKFECNNGYICSAGHVFYCTNNHSCDKFDCSAGTVKGCGDPAVAVSCDGTKYKNVTDYTPCQPESQYGNNDPGDFLCSFPGGTSDVFDCHKNFDCKAISDFACMGSGEFTCAQQGGGTNNFECNSAAPFECYSRFTCVSASLFKCKASGAAYNCKSSYALCKNNTEKECKSIESGYWCVAHHGCFPAEPSTEHDCPRPAKFSCEHPSPYHCMASEGYSNPG